MTTHSDNAMLRAGRQPAHDGGVPRLPDPVPVAPAPPPATAWRADHLGRSSDGGGAWSPDAVRTAHRETLDKMHGRRAADDRRRAIRMLIMAVVAGTAVAGVGWLSSLSTGSFFGNAELPRFDAPRPPAGTVHTEFAHVFPDGEEISGSAWVNVDATEWRMTVERADGVVDVKFDEHGHSSFDGGGWVPHLYSPEEEAEVQGFASMLARVPIFSDYVPDVARRYVVVLREEEAVAGGRTTERIDMSLDLADFQRHEPVVYEAWAERVQFDLDVHHASGARLHLALWVDAAGIVWRMESGRRADDADAHYLVGDGAFSRFDLVSYDTARFDADDPTVPAPGTVVIPRA